MTREKFLGFGCSATTLLKSQFRINTFSVEEYQKRIDNGIYKMTLKGAFYYHFYENYYTLSYIDKMWNIMRKEAFPDKLVLK